jgi:predicted transcriptional regulator
MATKKKGIQFTTEEWLDELRKQYIVPPREDGEWTLQELADAMGCTKKIANRIAQAERRAGRMTRRLATVPGAAHPAMVYRRVK